MRAIWKGAVSFGLVNVPVRLYSATENHDISFHQVRASDGSRIRYKRVAQADGEEVAYKDIAKAYETEDGKTVILTDEDEDGTEGYMYQAVNRVTRTPEGGAVVWELSGSKKVSLEKSHKCLGAVRIGIVKQKDIQDLQTVSSPSHTPLTNPLTIESAAGDHQPPPGGY